MTDPGSPYRGGNGGGAFRATVNSGFVGYTGGYGGTANSFLTFCLELNENIALPQTSFAQINDGAINGGIGGGNPDPISNATAHLYRTYRASGAIGGDGQVDSSAEAGSLQLAFWFLEDELNNPNNALSAQYLGYYNADARAQRYVAWGLANGNVLGGVRAMTLWANANFTGARQDMLTIVPLPPAAWAGIASLAGIGAFGYVRRRSFRA